MLEYYYNEMWQMFQKLTISHFLRAKNVLRYNIYFFLMKMFKQFILNYKNLVTRPLFL